MKKAFFSINFWISVSLAIALQIINRWVLPTNWFCKYSAWLVVYFFLTTALAKKYLDDANQKSPQSFIRAFMGATALRILAAIVILFVYAIADRAQIKAFAIQFMILYLFYLVVEVLELQKIIPRR